MHLYAILAFLQPALALFLFLFVPLRWNRLGQSLKQHNLLPCSSHLLLHRLMPLGSHQTGLQHLHHFNFRVPDPCGFVFPVLFPTSSLFHSGKLQSSGLSLISSKVSDRFLCHFG